MRVTSIKLVLAVFGAFATSAAFADLDNSPIEQIPNTGNYTSPKNDGIAVDLGGGRAGFARVCLAMAGNINIMKAAEIRIPRNKSGSRYHTVARIETRQDYRGWNCMEVNADQLGSGTLIALSQNTLGTDDDIIRFSYDPQRLSGKSLNLHWNVE